MMIFLGLFFSLLSFLIIIYNIYLKITNQITELGYTSIITSIWFLAGIILSSMGVLGVYIGKIYDGVKNRPLYIISEKIAMSDFLIKKLDWESTFFGYQIAKIEIFNSSNIEQIPKIISQSPFLLVQLFSKIDLEYSFKIKSN